MKTSRRRFVAQSAAAIFGPIAFVKSWPTDARVSRETLVSQGQDYFPPSDLDGGWRQVTEPAQIRKIAGMDAGRLDQAFSYCKTTSKYGGLLVARHGYLVYEKYFGRASREVTPNMASCGKMFTSASWGILLAEHADLLPEKLNQKIFTEKYLPEAFPLSDSRKADIELGHLLTMTSGMAESSGPQGIVYGKDVKLEPLPPQNRSLDQDQSALRTPLWTDPGNGYFYSSQGVHVASIVLRHLVGKEMQAYIAQKLAQPMGFGGWGYDMRRPDGTELKHTPGAGGIALRATDALRFGYLLLHEGRWQDRQLIPAEWVKMCRQPSSFDPHAPFSLQFEVNEDGHVAGAPRDTFFKSGASGFCIYAIPSLDLAVYKIASVAGPKYDLGFGGKTNAPDESRDNWEFHPFDQFHDGKIDGDAGTRRLIEMVVASVVA